MRKFVTAQLALGLALLFGSSYFALKSYLGPTLDRDAGADARIGARLVAAETVIAWEDLLDARRVAVTGLAQTTIFKTFAADAKDSERPKILKAALEGALRGTGGVGSIGIFDAKGAPVIPGFDDALGGLATTKAALEGVSTARAESIGGVLHLVSAASAGGQGALVLSLPLGPALFGPLRATLPDGSHAALVLAGQVAGSTFPSEAALGDLGGEQLDVGGVAYRLDRRLLEDDAGGALSVVGLAPLAHEGRAPILEHLSLGLFSVGGAALVLVLLVTILGSRSAEEEEEIANTFDLPRPETPAPDAVVSAPPTMLSLKFNDAAPAAQLIRDATPIDFPAAPTPEPQPSLYAQKTLPAHPTPAPAPQPKISDGIPSWASSPSLPAPISAPPPPPPWSDPANPSLFDAIANAAVSPPPPPPVAVAPMSYGDDNLPAPKEGFSPEVLAAQRAAAQRVAHSAKPAPVPMAPNFASTPYDADLPMPKDAMAVAPFAPRASGPVFQNPSKSTPPTAPPQSAPMAMGGSRARAPSIPPVAAPSLAPRPAAIPLPGNPSKPAIPLPGNPSKPAIPLPGRSASTPGREAPARSSSIPGELNMSSLAPSKGDIGGADPKPFDEEHYRFVYNEFVSSKAKLGEAVENITYEGFRTKLRSSEQALLDRHGCRAVRFQVLVKDKTVSLRPQLVR